MPSSFLGVSLLGRRLIGLYLPFSPLGEDLWYMDLLFRRRSPNSFPFGNEFPPFLDLACQTCAKLPRRFFFPLSWKILSRFFVPLRYEKYQRLSLSSFLSGAPCNPELRPSSRDHNPLSRRDPRFVFRHSIQDAFFSSLPPFGLVNLLILPGAYLSRRGTANRSASTPLGGSLFLLFFFRVHKIQCKSGGPLFPTPTLFSFRLPPPSCSGKVASFLSRNSNSSSPNPRVEVSHRPLPGSKT